MATPQSQEKDPSDITAENYNLKKLKQICDESIAAHNITVEFQHIKAHQDEPQNRENNKNIEVLPLTQAALMNIDCNARAEE